MTTLDSELHELCGIEIGRTPARANRHYWNDGTQQWLSISDFAHGDEVSKTKECVTEKAVRECNLKVHPKGTLVMSFKLTIGKLAFLGVPMATNEAIVALTPRDRGMIDTRFLYHFLSQYNFDHLLDRAVKGRTLNKEKLRRIRVTYPKDLEEQRRIAAILDKADAIRRKREQALAMCDDFLRSVFLEMFGDPAKNPKGFPLEPVHTHLNEERAGIQSGPFGAALKKHEYVDAGIPVWGVENVQHNEFIPTAKLFITDEKFAQLERYSVLPGDILVSRAGTVGRMCIAYPEEERSIISTNLVRVALDNCSLIPQYFVALFTYFPHRLGALKANDKDDAFTFLNPKTLKALKIPIPPLDMQQKFRAQANAVRRHVDRMDSQVLTSQSLSASLAQRAFRGELLEAA